MLELAENVVHAGIALLLVLAAPALLVLAGPTAVEKRELVAELFRVTGVIASIEEVVVLSVEAAAVVGEGVGFRDRITEIAVLGVLVLLLGATSWLLRRGERGPDEGEVGEQEAAPGRAAEARG